MQPPALDISLVYPRLYQGAAPHVGPWLAKAGISTIVLCAYEWQPPRFVDPTCAARKGYDPRFLAYPGVEVVHAPADDNFSVAPSREVLVQAVRTANEVAARVKAGQNVLVSCWMGKNRSGLVTSLAIHKLTGWPGKMCLSAIKRARPQALTNPQFVAAVSKIQGRTVPQNVAAV
jgi:hypothetical protein